MASGRYVYSGVDDTQRWNSSNPLNALVGISIPGDNGTVIVSQHNSAGGIFTTIYDPKYGSHPVFGHRNFDYTVNPDGSYTFYTRGVDRLTDIYGSTLHDLSKFLINESFPFSQADNLWNSFQTGFSNFVNTHGGAATVGATNIIRTDWQKIKDILEGKRPVSDIAHNCSNTIEVDLRK